MTSTALLKAEKKARDERAWEAVKVFRRMLPSLNSFARALTHNPRIRVVMGARPETDGNVISICPPIKLGDKIPHVRRDCGLRDENYVPVCLACSTEEEIFVNCIHEIAHIVGLSFERTTDEDRTLALTQALQESSDALAERVKQKFNLAPERTRGDYMGLASLVSDFLPPLYNQLEDIRIDNHMFEARKGTKKMYKGDVWKIYNERREGFKLPKELPLNTQMVLGLWIEACEYDYEGWLHPQVEGHLKDPELQNLLWRVANARNAAAVWTLVFPVLACLRKLGYMLSPEERDEQQQMEQEQEPDSEPEEESSGVGDSDESKAKPDASEGSPESDDESESTPDMGGDSEGGLPNQEGEASGDDGVPDSAGEDSESAGDEEHAGPSQSAFEDSQDAGEDQQDQQGSDGDSGLPDVEGEDSSEGAGDSPDSGSDENLHESPEGAVVDDPSESSGDMDEASSQAEDAEGSFRDTEGSQGGSYGDGAEAPTEGEGDGEGDPRDGRDSSDSSGDFGQDDGASLPESLDEGDSLDSDSSDWSQDDLAPPGDGQGGMVESSTDGDSTELEASDSDDDASGESSSESNEEGGESGPIDSGVYRDDGAVQAPAPDYGDASGLQEAIDTVHKHGKPDVIGTENTEEEDKSVAKAIIQSMYFETASQTVAGVREHFDNQHVMSENGSDESTGFTRQISCDMEIPNGVLNPLLLKMKRMFRNNRISSFDADRKSGHVDARVLGTRAWDKNDGRLFGKLSEPEEKDYFVIIAGDISGSQMGVSLSLTKRAMKAQALLCHRAKVPFAIYAHSMVHSTQGMTLEVYVIKDVDERWTTATEELLDNLSHVAGNLDGHAVEYYRRKIDKIPAQERIIMYYTDGKMPAANHDEELEILQREIRTCKRKNIHLMGVGIRTDSPIRHGLDTVQVDTDDDLVKVVRHLGKMLT